MWVKERLINLAIARLPAHVAKVAWLDADILFTNPDWAQQTAALLDKWPLVQPQERAGRMAQGRLTLPGAAGAALFAIQRRPESAVSARRRMASRGSPGRRRNLIARHGVYDAAILDGGDELFAHAAGGGLNSRCVRGLRAPLQHRPFLVDKGLNRLCASRGR